MRYQYIQVREQDSVTVVELVAHIARQGQLVGLCEEIGDVCQRFRINSRSSVCVIMEEVPGLFAMGKLCGNIAKTVLKSSSLSQSIAECEKPVLIGIRGDAVDLGLEMALACDVRIASEASQFGLSQISSGLIPWDGGTQRLSRTIGKGKAMEMILTGELIDAQEAFRIGLISRAVPAEEVMRTVMEIATGMASKSSISLQYCKEAISKGMDLTLEQGLRLEADLYFLIHTTHDREEGIKAFQEKRKPEFSGN